MGSEWLFSYWGMERNLIRVGRITTGQELGMVFHWLYENFDLKLKGNAPLGTKEASRDYSDYEISYKVSGFSTNVPLTETWLCWDNTAASPMGVVLFPSPFHSLGKRGYRSKWSLLQTAPSPTRNSFWPLLLPWLTGHTTIPDDLTQWTRLSIHLTPSPVLFPLCLT